MCRNCAGFDDKDEADMWGAAFAYRDGKAAPAKPAEHALLNRKAVPAHQPEPEPRDRKHA